MAEVARQVKSQVENALAEQAKEEPAAPADEKPPEEAVEAPVVSLKEEKTAEVE